MERIVNGTKGLWDEWSMVRMVYTWYEKSVVRIVNGTNSLVIPPGTELRHILAIYIMCSCDLDI